MRLLARLLLASLALAALAAAAELRGATDRPRLAFFIEAGPGDGLDGVPRLLSAVYDSRHAYAVHADTQALARVSYGAVRDPETLLRARTELVDRGNVHVVPAKPVVWKGVSEVLSLVDGLATLLAADPDWGWCWTLGGKDVPAVRLGVLETIAQRLPSPRHSIVEAEPLPGNLRRRVSQMHEDPALAGNVVDGGLDVRDLQVEYPFHHNTPVFKGGSAFLLSRELAEELVAGAVARRTLLFLEHSRMAIELFVPTVARELDAPLVGARTVALLWRNADGPCAPGFAAPCEWEDGHVHAIRALRRPFAGNVALAAAALVEELGKRDATYAGSVLEALASGAG